MKKIYVVMSDDYNRKPLMAYEERNDAVMAACAVYDCDATDAADFIKSLPFVADVPKTVDLVDVQTVIDMTIKAVESVEARNGVEDDR